MKRGLAILLVVLAWGGRATANPSARLVYVRGAGAEGCPEEEALRTAVAARLGYDPFHAFATTTIFAEVKRDRDRFRAEVKLVDDHGVERGARRLETPGNDCATVIDAMALTISIVIDPLSLTSPHPPPEEQPAPPALPPPPAPSPSAALVSSPAPREAPPRAKADPVVFYTGIAALGSLGMEPSLTFGGALSAGLRWRSFAVGFEGRVDVPSSAVSSQGTGVRSTTLLGTLVPCAELGAPFACALVAVGSLQASSDAAVQRSASALYTAVGARLGVSIPMSRRFELRPYLDVLAALRGYTLQIGGADAYTFSPVSGNIGLALRVLY